MNRIRLAVLTVTTLATALGCATGVKSDIAFNPKVTEPSEDAPTVPTCAALAGITVEDARADRTAAGLRYQEDAPDQKYAVHLTSDLGNFVQDGVKAALARALVATGKQGQPTLHVSVTRLALEEKAAFNSEYHGRISLTVALDNGFTGEFDGEGNNYGKPGSAANYQETLSHALENAVNKMLADQGFVNALCGKPSAKTPAGSGAQTL